MGHILVSIYWVGEIILKEISASKQPIWDSFDIPKVVA